jgi:hypothetical protein
MKKEITLLLVALLLSVPVAGAIHQPHSKSITSPETTMILCVVDGKQIQREMSVSSIQDLIDLGGLHKEDFLTIYDKTRSTDDVAIAFENLKPFFQALIDNDLTEKTVEELNALYSAIRERIQEPRRQPICTPHHGPQPLGIWNGVPTPIWANIICGQFDVGVCAGFAGGTHMLIPTIGIDLFLTYAFQGTSISIGGFGYTIALTGFNFILGFVGILLATPLMMFGPYFLTGMSSFLVGVGV